VRKFVTVLILGIALVGCFAAPKSLAAEKPWSRHCSAKGIQTSNAEEAVSLAAAAARCEPEDACVLACSRSGCAEGIAGGCYHVCRGVPEDLSKRADIWSQRPSCRLPPNPALKRPSR
jgi:hypothetical protein